MLASLLLATSFATAKDVTKDHFLVVVGILKEARLAEGKNVTLLISGANSERLEQELKRQYVENVRAILSYGVAGGLNPNYRPGDVIIPQAIVHGDQRWETDAFLSSQFAGQLIERNLRVYEGALAGSDKVIMTPEGKHLMYLKTRADAVDMESHIAAAFAARHGIPFAAVRVISDPADRTLPSVTSQAITASGEIRTWSIIRKLLLHPWQLPDLIRAGRDSSIAFATLGKCQALLLMP